MANDKKFEEVLLNNSVNDITKKIVGQPNFKYKKTIAAFKRASAYLEAEILAEQIEKLEQEVLVEDYFE